MGGQAMNGKETNRIIKWLNNLFPVNTGVVYITNILSGSDL
jgi:hypothetical protein